MTTWDLGDRVPLRHLVYDADDQLVDATVAVTVVAPDGTITTPTVTHTSVGTYDTSVLASQKRKWQFRWDITGTVEDVAHGSFDVADPAPPLYYPLDRFKNALRIAPDDTSRDEELLERLDVASRGIEAFTNRRWFWLTPAATRTYRVADRVIRAEDGFILDLGDDIGDVDDMVVEIGSNTGGWTEVTDYDTGPDNALDDGMPIEWLIRPGGWGSQRARITTRWGFPAIPAVVPEATKLQASRLNKRSDTPEGIVGNADWGAVRLGRVDPDVRALIEKLERLG